MKLLKNLNFTRSVLLFGGLLAIGLGWLDYQMHTRLSEVELELAAAPKTVVKIQELGLDIRRLQDALRSEGIKGQVDAQLYIRQQAKEAEIGDVEVDFRPTAGAQKGITDKKYTIDLDDQRGRGLKRSKIANFCYVLESESQRVVVTRLKLDNVTNPKPGDHPPDRWDFTIDLLSRQRE